MIEFITVYTSMLAATSMAFAVIAAATFAFATQIVQLGRPAWHPPFPKLKRKAAGRAPPPIPLTCACGLCNANRNRLSDEL